MKLFRQTSKEPLWQDEFSIRAADERYVSRRQFTKFLVLTSLGMFVGNVWITVRAWLYKQPVYPQKTVADVNEIPVGGVRLFRYPTEKDPCILIRPDAETFVAYSQKCTHLSCAVYYAPERKRIECPCHEGYFAVKTGNVLQGPPTRPLPRVVLKREGDHLVAVAMETTTES
ncbi:MAG TPA: Rieske 2Fe-2S domain-containing protein [Verrucomicrobiae bacterium]|nr:Rieske 2Fe-2S domain-containing protein [Verrucomicrobiae bacterium]